MVLFGLTETAPLAPCVKELMLSVSPSGSTSLPSTLISTGVSSSVVAVSLLAVGAASCVMVTVLPATVNVPLRAAPVVFGATVKLTVPLLLPGAPELIVMNGLLLTAFQSQGAVADRFFVTVTLPVLPGEKNAWLVGETVAHDVGI